MNGAPNLSILSLIAAFALLVIPIAFSLVFGLGIVRNSLVAAARMGVQLFLAGLYLTWLFKLDSPWLNLAWLLVMILVAALTTVQRCQLRLKEILGTVLLATFATTLGVVLYFNSLVVRVEDLFAARYLIVLGGMLLGNSLSGNIISLTHYYSTLRDHEDRYLLWIGNGAARHEALRPFFREAMIRSMEPTLASMATLGIVALPGMMTGQMLGGSTPMVAIKYQIAIMLAILATVTLGSALALLLSTRTAFTPYGILRREIFRA